MIERDAQSPIDDGELADLFGPLAHYSRLVLAVSGGPDSMALMHLAARWRVQLPSICVATVDHGLRPESADEARFVASRASELGLAHTTLVWKGPRPETGVMAAARAARYRLLGELAGRESHALPAAVVTAHTEDDQAETLIMRLARGSGLDGLAGMAPARPLGGRKRVMLARPFLATPKSRLVATLKAAGVDFLSDPSNQRECYERVRLRHARAALEALGLTSERLALSARRLLRAKDAIESAVDTFIEAEVTLNGGAFALVAREAFAALEAEAKVRVLARLVRAFGGTTPEARLSQVEVLARDVGAGRSRLAVTLGGAIVSAGERAMRIYREPGRGVAHEIELRSGEEAVWDERFCVSFEALSAQGRSAPQVVIVRALGSEAYATLARSGVALTPMPARAAVGLPAFWSGERLISVPHLILPHGTLEDVAGSCRAVFIGCKRGAC